MRSRILLVPQIKDETTLRETLLRTGHYFAHLKPGSITINVSPDLAATAKKFIAHPHVTEDWGSAIPSRLRSIAGCFRIVPGTLNKVRENEKADIVLTHDTDGADKENWNKLLKKRPSNLATFVVDEKRLRHAGSKYAEAAHRLSGIVATIHNRSKSRLSKVISELGGAPRAYLVATGPSAAKAAEIDMSDGVRIVCNTVVLDQTLMEHVKPNLVVFADPVFHFGPSRYAHRFRAAVEEAVKEHDFWVGVPERYVLLLEALAPALKERIIGIRFSSGDVADFINLNLQTAPWVNPLPNILTLLMLPFAVTLADEISLLGFDGRSPDENYFWQHGKTVQLHDDMDTVKRVHPGFFSLVNYKDYYDEHVGTVERMIQAAESMGRRVTSVTPSFMPPLRRRQDPRFNPVGSIAKTEVDESAPLLVTVEPDWISGFGHHGPLNRRLREHGRQNGWELISLTSRGMHKPQPWQIPTFTYPTGNPRAAAVYGPTFAEELEAQLEKVISPSRTGETFVVMYTAALWHLPHLVELISRRKDNTFFVVNLMRAHRSIVEAAQKDNPLNWEHKCLASALELSQELPLSITVDSDALAESVEQLTGMRPAIWPMISLFEAPATTRHSSSQRPLKVFAPIKPQHVKGIFEFLRLAEKMLAKRRPHPFKFIARQAKQPTGTPKSIENALKMAAAAGVELMPGEVGDTEYLRSIADADLIVIPYHAALFRTRTSSVLIDTLLAKTPTLVPEGTWMASIVHRFDVGETFKDKDVKDMARALHRATARLEDLRANLDNSHEELCELFSPNRLVEFFINKKDAHRPCATKPIDRSRTLRELGVTLEHMRLEEETRFCMTRSSSAARELAKLENLRQNLLNADALTRSKSRIQFKYDRDVIKLWSKKSLLSPLKRGWKSIRALRKRIR